MPRWPVRPALSLTNHHGTNGCSMLYIIIPIRIEICSVYHQLSHIIIYYLQISSHFCPISIHISTLISLFQPKICPKIPSIHPNLPRFKLLSEADLEVDRAVDCALALVHQLGVWSLGLPTPAHIRPENALRNRVGSGGSCGICGRAVRRAQTKKKQIKSDQHRWWMAIPHVWTNPNILSRYIPSLYELPSGYD